MAHRIATPAPPRRFGSPLPREGAGEGEGLAIFHDDPPADFAPPVPRRPSGEIGCYVPHSELAHSYLPNPPARRAASRGSKCSLQKSQSAMAGETLIQIEPGESMRGRGASRVATVSGVQETVRIEGCGSCMSGEGLGFRRSLSVRRASRLRCRWPPQRSGGALPGHSGRDPCRCRSSLAGRRARRSPAGGRS